MILTLKAPNKDGFEGLHNTMRKSIFLLIFIAGVSTKNSEQGSVNCPVKPSDCPSLPDQQGQCDIDNDCPAGYRCTYQCSQGGTTPATTSPKLPSLPVLVSACPFDLVIWFDGVEIFEGLKPLEKTLGLIYRILNKFPVSGKGNHVALGVLSENPRVILHFNGLGASPQSNSKVREVLGRVKVIQDWELSRIDKALEMTHQMYSTENGARAHARKVLIVLTDGKIPIRSDILPLAMLSVPLQKKGVEVLAIGLTLDIDIFNLIQLASTPEYVYRTVSPEFLSSLQGIDKKPCPKAMK